MGTAFAGAVVNHSGSCAASANELILARGVKPNSKALSADIKIKADAPSFIVEALPAVTVPSFLNTVRKFKNFSLLIFLNSSSSETISASPRL